MYKPWKASIIEDRNPLSGDLLGYFAVFEKYATDHSGHPYSTDCAPCSTIEDANQKMLAMIAAHTKTGGAK